MRGYSPKQTLLNTLIRWICWNKIGTLCVKLIHSSVQLQVQAAAFSIFWVHAALQEESIRFVQLNEPLTQGEWPVATTPHRLLLFLLQQTSKQNFQSVKSGLPVVSSGLLSTQGKVWGVFWLSEPQMSFCHRGKSLKVELEEIGLQLKMAAV